MCMSEMKKASIFSWHIITICLYIVLVMNLKGDAYGVAFIMILFGWFFGFVFIDFSIE